MRQPSALVRSSIALMATLVLIGGTVAPSQATTEPETALISVTTFGGFVMPGTDQSNLPALKITATGQAIMPAENSKRFDVRTALLRQLPLERTLDLIGKIGEVSTPPKGGWGFPGVADVPNTRIVIAAPHLHRIVNVYALAFFNGGNLTPAQVKARKALNSAYNSLYKFVQTQKATVYKPATYEAWNGMSLVMGGSPDAKMGGGIGMANPASVFCEAMGGTLTIVDKADGQVGMCGFADGTSFEEWAFFRAESPKLGQWPAGLPAPSGACTVVPAKKLVSELARKNESGLWLLPTGSVSRLMFRPVLPGEKACQR